LAAAAATWRWLLDCTTSPDTKVSTFITTAFASMVSSLRNLLPLKPSPVASSRLIQIVGPPRCVVSRRKGSSGAQLRQAQAGKARGQDFNIEHHAFGSARNSFSISPMSL
jgi:hypothetical protein